MTPLQTDAHFQVFLFRFFRRSEHAANSDRIRRDRFLHEDMLAGLNCIFEMLRPVTWRTREKNNIRAAIDCFTISIEADELAFVGQLKSIARAARLSPGRLGGASLPLLARHRSPHAA